MYKFNFSASYFVHLLRPYNLPIYPLLSMRHTYETISRFNLVLFFRPIESVTIFVFTNSQFVLYRINICIIFRPEIRYIVASLNEMTGVPSHPDSTRRKFMCICRTVARSRVSINLPTWKQLPESSREALKNEILAHFVVRSGEDMKRLQRAALSVAGKSLRNWKNTLLREYVHKQRTPFDKYPQISEEEWAEFVANVN